MNEKNRFSLGKKMYIFVVAAILVATFGATIISYFINVSQIDAYFKTLTIDNARNFATMVDADFMKELREVAESEEYQAIRDAAEDAEEEAPVQEYLEEHGLWDRYVDQRTKMCRYLRTMEDIKYLYIVVWGGADEQYDMYLLDDDDNPITQTGYYEEREPEFIGVDPSAEIEPTISTGDWGWLCSGYAPVYDENGAYICHVGCDVGMDEIMEERRNSLILMLLGSLAFTVVVLVLAGFYLKKALINPLNALTREMKRFSPGEKKDYHDAGVIELDMKRKDEIGDIYEEIRSMQIRIIDYIDDITAIQRDRDVAELEVRSKNRELRRISREAFRDSLTGVSNKNAFDSRCEEIEEMIRSGFSKFAIVMIDINCLKSVNDNFGHNAGDDYIKGCCSIICEVFKHSPIYRVGGDEFVAILMDVDFDKREEHMAQLNSLFEEAYARTDLEQWQRYSASAGMSEYTEGDSVESVYARADKLMYEVKEEFRKKNGIVR